MRVQYTISLLLIALLNGLALGQFDGYGNWRNQRPRYPFRPGGTRRGGSRFPANPSPDYDAGTRDIRPVPNDQLAEAQTEVGVVSCVTPSGAQGTCQALSHCVYQFENVAEMERASCKQANGNVGSCCTEQTIMSRTSGNLPIRPPPSYEPKVVPVQGVSAEDINEANIHGRNMVDRIDQIEAELARRGLVVQDGSSTAFHQAVFGRRQEAIDRGREGLAAVEAAKRLASRMNAVQGRTGQSVDIGNTIFSRQGTVQPSLTNCPAPAPCPNSRYRLADGRCNNVRNPHWGQSLNPFERVLPPRYGSEGDNPRVGRDGSALPSTRLISATVSQDRNVPHDLFSLAWMQWGQFVAHDVTLAGLTRARDGSGIICCDPQIQANPQQLLHPACFPISIPQEDPFFGQFSQNCMEFVRSLVASRQGCELGHREQMDQVTSFIDASQVYGSTDNDVRQLRSFQGGKLRVSRINNVDMMPQDTNVSAACAQSQANQFCFRAGDVRVNQHTSLTSLQTVFLREHNRLAEQLARINANWNDETLFQESRKIVSAVAQHITFNEFLPLVIGRGAMERFGLLLVPQGYFNEYNATQNPTIFNGFATAAYRFGHSTAQGRLNLVNNRGAVVERIPLATQFFNPLRLYQAGEMDRFLLGLVTEASQMRDRFVSDQLTNHLFEPPGQRFGLDLVSINTQRGRDHGLPGYNEWRRLCGLSPITSFRQLEEVLDPATARAFGNIYRHVDDIDFFPAGISEFPLPNSVLGPTMACIVSEQFRRLRYGDRFWYENGNMEHSFTPAQLMEIRRGSLSRIICDNADNIVTMQPLALLQPATWNPRVRCTGNDIPNINLNAWGSGRTAANQQTGGNRGQPGGNRRPEQRPNGDRNRGRPSGNRDRDRRPSRIRNQPQRGGYDSRPIWNR